jgi:hypothetical protein
MISATDLMQSMHVEKTTIIQRRIIKELTGYYSQHSKGLPMQMLSAKYAKSIQSMGIGFPEFVDNMRLLGMLQVQFQDHGARSVYPNGVNVPNISPIAKEWF